MDAALPFIQNRYGRFLSKVKHRDFSSTECWTWCGASKGNGYGNVRMGKKNETAHRHAYKLFVSPNIPDGMDVCHSCDNRCCVNPDHLFIGTRRENMAAMKQKGRGAGGARKHLREDQIQEIRQRLAAGVSPRQIANQLGVNYGTVTSIKRGESYVGLGK